MHGMISIKNGRILFDRPKPTAGSSANGRRRRTRTRRRRRRRKRRIISRYLEDNIKIGLQEVRW
jgi:hypothetical protein